MVVAGPDHAQDTVTLQRPRASLPARRTTAITRWLELQDLDPDIELGARLRHHGRIRKDLRRRSASELPTWTPHWLQVATRDLWEASKLKEARKLLTWAHERLGAREQLTLDLSETLRRQGRLQKSAHILQSQRPQQHSQPMAWWTARTRLAATGCHWTHLHNLLQRARLLHEIDQSWAWHRQILRSDPHHPDLLTAIRLQPDHPHARLLAAERLMRMGQRKLGDELLVSLLPHRGLPAAWAQALRLAYGTLDAPPPDALRRTVETWSLALLLRRADGQPAPLKGHHRPTLLRLQQDWLDALQGHIPQTRWRDLATALHTPA